MPQATQRAGIAFYYDFSGSLPNKGASADHLQSHHLDAAIGSDPNNRADPATLRGEQVPSADHQSAPRG